MRTAIYIRVSSEEQLEGHSLSAQKEACRQLAATRDWDVVHVFEERGVSAKSADRPQFQEMIRAAESNLFEFIIVHKLDRFSRNVSDTMIYLSRLKDHGVSLVSVTEQGFDFSTPHGKMLLGILSIFAQWYLDNLSAETSKGKKERARRGGWNGTLPFGYTNLRRLQSDLDDLDARFNAGEIDETDYDEMYQVLSDTLREWTGRVDESAAIPCPVNAPGVQLAFETYARGVYSDNDVAKILTEAGYRTTGNWGQNLFGKDTITPMLKNRFYLGETSYQGKKRGAERQWQEGSHEPIISEELFDRALKARKKRAGGRGTNRSPGKRNVYPLSSIMICAECGTPWRGKLMRQTRYYRDPAFDLGRACEMDPKTVRADDLEDQIAQILFSLEIPVDWQEQIVEKIQEERRVTPQPQADQKGIKERLERLRDLYEIGDIDRETYLARRDVLQSQLQDLPVPVQTTVVDMERVVALLKNSQALWEAAKPRERKMWLNALFRQVYIYEGNIRAVEPTPILSMLLSAGENEQPTQRRGMLIVPPETPLEVVRTMIEAQTY
ncbi:MAG: recombinase family protein [Chloroflexota bacterium]